MARREFFLPVAGAAVAALPLRWLVMNSPWIRVGEFKVNYGRDEVMTRSDALAVPTLALVASELSAGVPAALAAGVVARSGVVAILTLSWFFALGQLQARLFPSAPTYSSGVAQSLRAGAATGLVLALKWRCK